MNEVHSSDSPYFPHVVHKAYVSFGGGVELSHLDVPESIQKVSPYVRPHAVTDGQSDLVLSVVVSL